ncbi:hypothetical protein Q764_14065 [Flavobacterium suncheonense GH29-5 = DSM 17707]|uniref:Uncharacterized protein n=2 Tax=Flavobacterium suncheonense TaxID=350894 RepID=A0A0A2LYJ6_9FLAO|nr:hypothetical protein Q764_14065 [Flavobacterium suncheonense GH29-5 = DSM 17707]
MHFSPIFELFSFKLFGIFVNNSNKNPQLLKAGGTLVAIMKNAIIIAFLVFFLTAFTSCNKAYNKIEITFSKSDVKDTIPIRYSLLKLLNEDSIIFEKKVIDDIKIGEKYVLDSLPNGNYILEYSDIKSDIHARKINLNNNSVYKSTIIYDSLPLEKYYKYAPLNNLKKGESYKLFTWGNSCARMESFYEIKNINGKYFLNSNVDNKRLLTDDEIKSIKKFEAELYALNGKGTCNSTARMDYVIIKGIKRDTIIEKTCNWKGYNLLMSKLYNSN